MRIRYGVDWERERAVREVALAGVEANVGTVPLVATEGLSVWGRCGGKGGVEVDVENNNTHYGKQQRQNNNF